MKNNTMAHTGLYLGESVVAQAEATEERCTCRPFAQKYWTDWAIQYRYMNRRG